jgi:hypothetical protein
VFPHQQACRSFAEIRDEAVALAGALHVQRKQLDHNPILLEVVGLARISCAWVAAAYSH